MRPAAPREYRFERANRYNRSMITTDSGEPQPGPAADAFAWRSLRWLLAALLAMGLTALLGFEAIMYRVAPLHARLDPALGDLRILPSMLVLAVAAALVLRRTALSPPLPVPLPWVTLCLAGAVTMTLAWAWDSAALPLLAFHALAVAVFATGTGTLLNAAAAIGLPRAEPAPGAARALLLGIVLFAFVFAGSLALIRGGTGGLEALAEHPPLSYIGDLDKVGWPHALFRDFTGMHPGLSPQSQLHPPGALLLVWGASLLAAGSPPGIVLILMAMSALAIIPLYGWISTMTSRRTALIAAMGYAVMPGPVLFASGSADAAFAFVTFMALFAHARAERDDRSGWAFAAGGLFACASLLHFALLTLAVWIAATGILGATRKGSARPLMLGWLAMGSGFALLHGALHLLTGFSYLESFQLTWESLHAHSTDSPRAGWYLWPPLTALALTFYAGIPVLLLSMHAVRSLPPEARALARCGLFVFVSLALLFLGTGEGERAAYYAYPFLLLPAALLLDHDARVRGSLVLTATALGLCALQSWIMQAYFQV